MICYNLGAESLGSFRSSCKRLDSVLFKIFGYLYFVGRKHMLSKDSLDALFNISQSRYSPFMRHLVMGSEVFAENPGHNRPFGLTERLQSHQDDLYCRKFVECLTFRATGEDVHMLAKSIRALPNLDRFTLTVGYIQSTIFGKTLHYRASYGCASIRETTGFEMCRSTIDRPGHSADFASRIFCALSRSERKLQFFRTDVNLPDAAFNIPHSIQSSFIPVLAQLSTLVLNLPVLERYPVYRRCNRDPPRGSTIP